MDKKSIKIPYLKNNQIEKMSIDLLVNYHKNSKGTIKAPIPVFEIVEYLDYHLDFNDNYIQTFAKLEAYVGVSYTHLGWGSDTEHCVDMWNYTDCNDVVNPAARHDSSSPIYGMPILELENAKSVLFSKAR